MPALQHFFDAERLRRGWSMRELAKRSTISLSKAYAISNGDDNVEFETFENIASAFSMSPAELAIAIGKGPASADPKRVPIHAVLRDVPDEQLGTVEVMLRGLTVQPARRANARLEAADKNAEQLQPDLTNEAMGKSEPRHLRPGKGKLALTHGTRWFRLSDSLLAIFQPLLALVDANRDSGPAAATA